MSVTVYRPAKWISEAVCHAFLMTLVTQELAEHSVRRLRQRNDLLQASLTSEVRVAEEYNPTNESIDGLPIGLTKVPAGPLADAAPRVKAETQKPALEGECASTTFVRQHLQGLCTRDLQK